MKIIVCWVRENINYTLSILCIILFTLGFFVNDPFGIFEESYQNAKKILRHINLKSVDRVIVQEDGKKRLLFRYVKDQWEVSDSVTKQEKNTKYYRADTRKIKQLLDELFEAREYRNVSSRKADQEKFEIGKNALNILLQSGDKTMVSIFVGKPGDTRSTTLMRLAEKADIYSVKGNLKVGWSKSISEYRDKKLFYLSASNINSMKVQGKYNYTILKSDGMWKFDKSGTRHGIPVASKVSVLLKGLSVLEGKVFQSKQPKLPLFVKIILNVPSGDQLSLEIYGPDKYDSFIAQSTQLPEWVTIAKWQIDSLSLEPTSLVERKSDVPK